MHPPYIPRCPPSSSLPSLGSDNQPSTGGSLPSNQAGATNALVAPGFPFVALPGYSANGAWALRDAGAPSGVWPAQGQAPPAAPVPLEARALILQRVQHIDGSKDK